MIWRPDTCKCVLEYNGENIPANFVRAVSLCPAHKKDKNSTLVLAENTGKNKALAHLAQIPKLQKKVQDSSGKFVDTLDETLVSWSFDKNRKLVIKTPTLSDSEKKNAKALLAKINKNINIA